MYSHDRFEKIYRFFTSRRLAIVLFGAVCLASIPGTFSEKGRFYSSPVFVSLLALLGLSLLFCTIRRARTLPRPVLVLHLGVIVTLIGGVVSSFGFVATVNVYEGKAVNAAFRWDTKEDMPLGVDLTVKKIHVEYYPVPVKVGVLRGGKKEGLFTLMTGSSFDMGRYRVRADEINIPGRSLTLSVYNEGHFIGRAETAGKNSLPSDFEYGFVLVAYKNPTPKRVWVDVVLSRGKEIIAQGTSEVNSPFEWQGLRFFHTSIERDPYGIAYAGIQITRDPGMPVVYAGFAIICFGALAYLARRLYGLR